MILVWDLKSTHFLDYGNDALLDVAEYDWFVREAFVSRISFLVDDPDIENDIVNNNNNNNNSSNLL